MKVFPELRQETGVCAKVPNDSQYQGNGQPSCYVVKKVCRHACNLRPASIKEKSRWRRFGWQHAAKVSRHEAARLCSITVFGHHPPPQAHLAQRSPGGAM